MADSAARCGVLSQEASFADAQEISGRVQQLNAMLEEMKGAAEKVPSVRPVIHFLDWQCRMMPPNDPTGTFRAHEREYRGSARMLREAAHRFELDA